MQCSGKLLHTKVLCRQGITLRQMDEVEALKPPSLAPTNVTEGVPAICDKGCVKCYSVLSAVSNAESVMLALYHNVERQRERVEAEPDRLSERGRVCRHLSGCRLKKRNGCKQGSKAARLQGGREGGLAGSEMNELVDMTRCSTKEPRGAALGLCELLPNAWPFERENG